MNIVHLPSLVMKQILWFTAFILFMISQLHAQETDFHHYQTLQSSGKIPDDFTGLSSEKYMADKQQIDENSKREDKQSEDQFFLESNFLMDEVLHSGRVIFGDPVTQYLNAVKDSLVKDDPELKNKIRIYTFRSTDVNAFTANNGVVLVTTGLIAQLENEAQLAFILSHEFTHYTRHHALTEYVEDREMLRGSGIYKNLDPNDIELREFQYSKDLENQADSLGAVRYKKSGYSPKAVERVFDVLLYSYLPFDEVDFNKNFFNDSSYHLPGEYFLDQPAPITAIEDYDDEKSTHPNIKRRRAAMIEAMKTDADSDKKYFMLTEATFKNIRQMCRYENSLLYLNETKFENAFYNTFLLLQDDPDNLFLKKEMARTLYAVSIYKNENEIPVNQEYYKNIEGASQEIFYLFNKIPKKEFNVLALRFAWMVYKSDPEDETVLGMCQQLAEGLKDTHDLRLSDFKNAFAATTDTLKKQEPVKSNSKYDKIKSSEGIKNSDVAYWRFAYVRFMNDESFQALFNDRKKAKGEATSGSAGNKSKNDEFALGIDKTVIVNPLYMKVDETSRVPVKYIAAEALRIDLRDKIMQCADLLKIHVDYLESKTFEEKDVDAFNDVAVLNNWISEELDHEGVPVINSNNEAMQKLVGKYKTDYFSWFGVISYKEKKQGVGGKILLSLIILPALPFTIADAVKPDYSTAVFSLVANGRSGNLEMQYFNAVDAKDLTSIQKSNLYYIMQQMKNKLK